MNIRQIAIFFSCLLFPAVPHAKAQSQQLPANYQNMALYELDRACDALVAGGFTPADRANAFVAWMGANDWHSLDINDLYNLYEWLQADAVDAHRFSARWTGFISAPATGAYTFRQLPVYKGANVRLKLTLGGQVILNSAADQAGQIDFVSSPVQLTAGQPVAIQVELVHSFHYVRPVYDFSESAPMAALTWKKDQGAESLIPTSAYLPPEGFAGQGITGLKGEYFGNVEFGDLKRTRLDPALDLVWTWPPVVPTQENAANEVLALCKSRILSGEFLAANAVNRPKVLTYQLWRIAYHLTAAERRQLVNIMRGQPAVLQAMTPLAMGRLSQGIYVLPGDEHIDLIGEWAMSQPQPRSQAGIFPGYGAGYYQALNTDDYWVIARFMQGPYANDADTLCDRYLERPEGECNLPVAYVGAFASQLNNVPDRFRQRLDERINDQALTGDKLVTWLIARAFTKEAIPGRIEPLAGYSDLESALVAAETSQTKFWVLQEMVARLSSVNKGDAAKQLIEEHRGEFNTEQQQAQMNQWTTKADKLSAGYLAQQAAARQASTTVYVTELERRRQAALSRGDDGAAARFGQLLSAAQSTNEQ